MKRRIPSPIKRHPPLILDARSGRKRLPTRRRVRKGDDMVKMTFSVLFLGGLMFAGGKVAHDRRLTVSLPASAVAMEMVEPSKKEVAVSLPSLPKMVEPEPIKRIKDYALTKGVDPKVVAAVIYHESGGKPKAVGTSGEKGLMQLMPGTWKEFGVKNPFDPLQNMKGGIDYLAWCKENFGSKYLRCYNGGPKNVDIEKTKEYERAVLANLRNKERLAGILSDWLHLPLG